MKSNEIDNLIAGLNTLIPVEYDSGKKNDPVDLTELSNDNYVYASDLNKICDTLNLLIDSSNDYVEVFGQLKTDLNSIEETLDRLTNAGDRKYT